MLLGGTHTCKRNARSALADIFLFSLSLSLNSSPRETKTQNAFDDNKINRYFRKNR